MSYQKLSDEQLEDKVVEFQGAIKLRQNMPENIGKSSSNGVKHNKQGTICEISFRRSSSFEASEILQRKCRKSIKTIDCQLWA